MVSKFATSVVVCGLALGAAPALAQSANTTLVDVTIPDSFDRGRNQSVLERPRPDYNAQPIPVGAFNVFPKVEVGAGASDNVYQTNDDKNADAYFFLRPTVYAESNWSVHAVEFTAGGNFKRYLDETPRDLSLFNFRTLGRLDMAGGFTIYGEARYHREYESAQTGAVQVSTTGAFSTYDRAYFALRGERQVGQSRITLAVDHSDLDFNPVKSTAFGTIDQSTRDRTIDRGTGRFEYAFTPSVAAYAQASYEKTDYRHPIPLLGGNRDSDGFRVLGGFSFDLAGLMRGKVGLGYAKRNYKLPIFDDVSGFSADAKIEYFPSELTTVTFVASRTIEDTAIGSTSSYYDTKTSLRVDHELLRNLLIHGLAEIAWQNYLDDPLKATNYRINVGLEYYSNTHLRTFLNFNGFHRNDSGNGPTNNFYEKSVELSVSYAF